MKKVKLFYGFLLIVLLHVSVSISDIKEFVDYKIYDTLQTMSLVPQQKDPSSTLVVTIDEKSLNAFGQWPWSRVIMAQLIQKIDTYNPAGIGLDILFAEADKTSPIMIKKFYKQYFDLETNFEGVPKTLLDHDALFASALKNSRSTLAVYMQASASHGASCDIKSKYQLKIPFETEYKSNTPLCNIPTLQKNATNIGFINASVDRDGILRRLPLFIGYKDASIPSFALANIMSIEPVKIEQDGFKLFGEKVLMDNSANVLLNFFKKREFVSISAVDVLSGNVDAKKLRGKFVLVGPSAAGLYDRYFNALGEEIPGVFMHANMIENLIQNSMIYEYTEAKNINIFFSFALSLLLLFILYKKQYLYFVGVFLLFTCMALGLEISAMLSGMHIFIAYFLVPFVLVFSIFSFVVIFAHYKERQDFFKELYSAHSSTIDSMALVAETRDTETGAHIKRTKEYVRCLGEYMYENGIHKKTLTKEFRELLYKATPLHDIGKVGIPDYILKKPGKLTQEEYGIMKEHPAIGKNILENAMQESRNNVFLKIARNIAYGHHEKWDGSGYPQGLTAEEIPLEARMMALADVYDALISRRYYKDSFSYKEAENIIFEGNGSHFDPSLIEVFTQLKEEFKAIAEKIKE